MSNFHNNNHHIKRDKQGTPYTTWSCFFDNINGNILLCCMVNEPDETMPFLRSEKIKPGREILVGLDYTVHISEMHQNPIPFHRPNLTNTVPIEIQLVFRLTKKAFDRPTLGIVAQDVFIALLPIGAQDAVKMFRCHRLIGFTNKQHHRMVETVERSFVTIYAITLFSHRDEVSVTLDGDAFRLEHRDDMESLFQEGFDELFGRIP